MKKLATLAILLAVATSASAASIQWGFGGQVYVSKDGSSAVLSTSYTDTVPYALALVYVGQNQSTFDIGDLSASSVVDTLAYAVSTSGKTAGKWNPTLTTTTTTAYADNASFAIVLYDAAAGSFDYVYSGSTAVGSAVKETTTVSDMSARGSATMYATGGTGTSSGVVSVPEPSVALLGLLGIGMLLKRRRA